MALGHTQAMVSRRRPLEDAGKPACSWAVAVSSRWPDPVGSCRRLSQLASLWYLWVSSGLRPSITGLPSEWWWPYPVEAGETSGVWGPGSGRTLGTCPSVRWGTREPTCSGVSGWRMTSSQPTPKLISLKKENFKPDMIKSKKSFEGPYSSRCFAKINICSNYFARIIASCCSMNRQHQEMSRPGMPQTSSRTYCLRWDRFQQWWYVFQLMKTHAYTFTAGGFNFTDMQRQKGECHGHAELLRGSTSWTSNAEGIDFTFTAWGSPSQTCRGRREMRSAGLQPCLLP